MTAGTIFIIDDNPDNLSLLAGILRERGYQIRMATTGRWALEAIRRGLRRISSCWISACQGWDGLRSMPGTQSGSVDE